jgi:hypothetical protein
VYWHGNLGGALLTAAVGALLGAGLTLLVIQLTRRRAAQTLPQRKLSQEAPPEEKPTPGEPE